MRAHNDGASSGRSLASEQGAKVGVTIGRVVACEGVDHHSNPNKADQNMWFKCFTPDRYCIAAVRRFGSGAIAFDRIKG